MALHSYLPQDRLRALSQDAAGTLAEHGEGAALFADISGFTALTERLSHAQGERRGIEALSQQVNAVYDALVGEIERWGGSVIGFAGDAVTCWWDGAQALPRALAGALALQAAMRGFPGLSLKVGLAAGPARRFVIELAGSGRLDVLAGATVTQAVQGESLARAGEVLLQAAAAATLGLEGEPRTHDEGTRFVVVDALRVERLSPPQAAAPLALPEPDTLQPWLLPHVVARETAGEALFLTDLRPATALFLRFGGLDYDADASAPQQLAQLVRTAQACIERHGGVLLELTVGDKGSYLYANFGAAQVHEDDPRRALHAALALRAAFAESPHAVQMGLSCGILRVGGYGARTRQSFGAIGDEVNAAARLMSLAQPGEILLSGRLRQALGAVFALEARPPLPMKGKAEPVPVFAALGLHRARAQPLQAPMATLPLVGRSAELAQIDAALARALQGQGQVLALSGEAGMGKSRLIVEGLRLARQQGFQAYGGVCAFDGQASAYGVWQPIWAALFDFDPAWPQRKQLRALEAQLREHAPEHLEALPLLARVLGGAWPDSPFTAALSPQDGKALLEATLLQALDSMLREAAQDGQGLLWVLEDLQAIDPLSLELLLRLAQAVQRGPLLLLLSYRAPLPTATAERLRALPAWAELPLQALAPAQAEQLIRAKLAALFPERVGAVPAALIERLTQQAQGNPYYIEELLNYLHDRGLDPRQVGPREALALPASLHSLVLSRIDQLPSAQQHTLKVASVIGQMFAETDLHGYHPAAGELPQLREQLAALDALDLTARAADTATPSHLFKQRITRDAAYASMPERSREALHGELARYLEAQSGGAAAAQLAHHYALAGQWGDACRHLVQAGEEAAAQFANEEALACFERALAHLPEDDAATRWRVLLRREALHDLQGQPQARRADLARLEALALHLPHSGTRRAELAIRRAKLETDLGDYTAARDQACEALVLLVGDRRAEAEPLRVDALLLEARALFYSGEAASSRPQLERALALARACGDARGEYNSLAQLGLVQWQFGDFDAARALLLQALARVETAGDVRRQIDLLNNLGVVANGQGRSEQAVQHYEQGKALARRIGDRSAEATLLNNQGAACLNAGDYVQAGERAARAVALFAELQEPAQQGMSLITLGESLRELGALDEAQRVAEQALAVLRRSQSRRGEAIVLENLGQIAFARGQGPTALQATHEALTLARALGADALRLGILHSQARIQLAGGELARVQATLEQAEALLQARTQGPPLAQQQALRAQLSLARDETAQAVQAAAPLLARLLAEDDADAHRLPLWVQAAVLAVLQAAQDARTPALAQRARARLQALAARIPEAGARQRFLALPTHALLQAPPP